MSAPADSVPISPSKAPRGAEAFKLRPTNIKIMVLLFFWYLFVSSNLFTQSIIARFGDKAVHGRDLTQFGHVIAGVFIVIGYILSMYLTSHKII